MKKGRLVEKVRLYHIKVPIKQPYHLAFGDVTVFESSIVQFSIGGERYFGESTPLPGYSDETMSSVAMNHFRWFREVLDQEAGDVVKAISPFARNAPFAANAFLAPIETFLWRSEGRYCERDLRKKAIPIVGIVSSNEINEIAEQINSQIRQGFQVIKIKVGSPDREVQEDIDKVRFIKQRFPKVDIRIDANQSYNLSQAKEFVYGIRDLGIQLFEQPLGAEMWNDQRQLFKLRDSVPLMLDESIRTLLDLRRTIELECTDWVKFKIMKQGGLENTLRLIEEAQEAGLKVIVGNGVQTEIGCLQEALLLGIAEINDAAENNGFLKQKGSILDQPIRFKNGNMYYEEPKIAISALKDCTINVEEIR